MELFPGLRNEKLSVGTREDRDPPASDKTARRKSNGSYFTYVLRSGIVWLNLPKIANFRKSYYRAN